MAKEQRLPSKNALLKRALKLGLSPWEKVKALEMGMNPNLFSVDEDDLILQTKAVLDRSVQWSEPTVIKWVAGVFIAARTNPTILRRVALLIQGKGWYRCWLEYVVEIARFKANPTGSILPAFKLLTNETNPFVGKPRACDLYGIRSVINVTLRLGLKHISDEEWPSVLAIMQEVSNNTTTSLQGSLNGPLSTEPLLKLVANFTTSHRQQATISFMEGFFKDAIASRTYYDAIARYHLLRARLSVAVGDIPNAEEYWRKAARLNACYGQRKDVTIFELLDSLPELIDYDIIEARKRLVRLQPLVRRTLRHTDLKETRHALPTWWGLVAKADGIGASNLIARQMFDTPNRPAGQLQDAQFKLHIAQGQKIVTTQVSYRLAKGEEIN